MFEITYNDQVVLTDDCTRLAMYADAAKEDGRALYVRTVHYSRNNLPSVYSLPKCFTYRELIVLIGMEGETIDFSLPVGFHKAFMAFTDGIEGASAVVWWYPQNGVHYRAFVGEPFALTKEAKKMLDKFNNERFSHV